MRTSSVALVALTVVVGCQGPQGEDGAAGEDGTGCSVSYSADESATTITCPDGTSVVLPDPSNGDDGPPGEDGTPGQPGQDGAPGADGTSCTVERNEAAGTSTISCEDGTVAVVVDGQPGAAGSPGGDGTSCTAARDDANDRSIITCEDGTVAIVNDGSSCSATRDNVLGLTTIECDDGTSAVVLDGAAGVNGEDGADGQDGADGAPGQDGEDGEDGVDCTVARSGAVATIVCSDGTTATVTDGLNSIARLDDILPGPTCVFGGTTLSVGLDDNRNGALDAGEESSTSTICAGRSECDVVEGSVEIQNSLDLDQLRGCAEITGDLTFRCQLGMGSGTTLANVDGLEALQRVGGEVQFLACTDLQNFDGLSGLEEVGGSLQFISPVAATTISLPSLTLVQGGLNLAAGLFNTTTFIAPSLIEVGALAARDNPVLDSLSLPALERVRDAFTVQRNPSLPQATVSALLTQVLDRRGVGGPIVVCGHLGGDGC